MLVKKHYAEKKLLLAIADSDLIGKKFEENNRQLDLTGSFYKGDKLNEKETMKLIKEAYILNIIGEKSVNFILKQGLIEKKNIIYIQKIPHAQCVLIKPD